MFTKMHPARQTCKVESVYKFSVVTVEALRCMQVNNQQKVAETFRMRLT